MIKETRPVQMLVQMLSSLGLCAVTLTWVHTSKDTITRDTLLLTYELKLRRGI